jgi:hypothetical protein
MKSQPGRGKKAYLQMGKMTTGTGKGLYGYKWGSTNKKRIPLEFEAKIVQRIFEMLADGMGCFHVATTLNDQEIRQRRTGNGHPGQSTIWRAILVI